MRLLASRLPEFGWQPVVVTVGPEHYEEANDEASLALLPEDLRVERVGAWPVRICRPLGFGDVALRGQWTMRGRVRELVASNSADLVFATVLPGYTSLVGAWAKRKFRLPFVLDYQDPWVSEWGASRPSFSKTGLTHRLATWLEPGAVACADALTAVSDETLQTLYERKLVRPGLPTETIPIGADANDHVVAAKFGRSWITRSTNEFVLAYTGTIIEGMLPSVRALFRAVRALADSNLEQPVRIHFIGTSAQPTGRDTFGLERLADELGVGTMFRLEPRRIGYLDALRTMQEADALLLLGSQASHYTASKIFPCWLSRKPVLALFHAESTVHQLAEELGGVCVVAYDGTNGAETRAEAMARVLGDLIQRGSSVMPSRNEAAFKNYSARGVAMKFAALFNRVLNRPNPIGREAEGSSKRADSVIGAPN